MLVQGCGHGMPVPGARTHLLGDEGFLGSSFLAAWAPDVEGLVLGLRALEPGLLLGEEVAEALHEPCRPFLAEDEAARGTARESPLQC